MPANQSDVADDPERLVGPNGHQARERTIKHSGASTVAGYTMSVSSSTPSSIRAGEPRQLKSIRRHYSGIDIRVSAAALPLRGLPDPEVEQVIDEREPGQEVLSRCQPSLRASRTSPASIEEVGPVD